MADSGAVSSVVPAWLTHDHDRRTSTLPDTPAQVRAALRAEQDAPQGPESPCGWPTGSRVGHRRLRRGAGSTQCAASRIDRTSEAWRSSCSARSAASTCAGVSGRVLLLRAVVVMGQAKQGPPTIRPRNRPFTGAGEKHFRKLSGAGRARCWAWFRDGADAPPQPPEGAGATPTPAQPPGWLDAGIGLIEEQRSDHLPQRGAHAVPCGSSATRRCRPSSGSGKPSASALDQRSAHSSPRRWRATSSCDSRDHAPSRPTARLPGRGGWPAFAWVNALSAGSTIAGRAECLGCSRRAASATCPHTSAS